MITEPHFDADDTFIHRSCECGEEAPFGFRANLRRGRLGLICRAEAEGGRPLDAEGNQPCIVTHRIGEVELGWDEVITEGYDANGSPLGRPVYWRIVNRGDEQLYCSTFLLERDIVIKGWGDKGAYYCDPVTGMAVARLETLLAVSVITLGGKDSGDAYWQGF